MANMYLKTTVFELILNNPNDHVVPSRGEMTTEALTPGFALSNWDFLATHFHVISCHNTNISITMFTKDE